MVNSQKLAMRDNGEWQTIRNDRQWEIADN